MIPTEHQLITFAVPGSVYRLEEGLQAPYTLQSVFSVERQLPRNMTIAASYINIRTLHVSAHATFECAAARHIYSGRSGQRNQTARLRGLHPARD